VDIGDSALADHDRHAGARHRARALDDGHAGQRAAGWRSGRLGACRGGEQRSNEQEGSQHTHRDLGESAGVMLP
jgi:hypothetical protein